MLGAITKSPPNSTLAMGTATSGGKTGWGGRGSQEAQKGEGGNPRRGGGRRMGLSRNKEGKETGKKGTTFQNSDCVSYLKERRREARKKKEPGQTAT